jgi:hypothetical protein
VLEYSSMASDPQPRIRRAPISDRAVLVVRGDELDSAVIRADATRFRRRFPAWGRFGVSAFVASDEDEIDALCETKLRAWSTVVVFTLSALQSAGIEVVPTFRVPHVTLADPSLDALTEKLLLCDHRVIVNPYHEADIGPLEGQ